MSNSPIALMMRRGAMALLFSSLWMVGVAQAATIDKTTLSYAAQKVGTTSATQTLTISNEGLTTSNIQVSIDNPSFIIVSNGCAGVTLNVLTQPSCTVTVAYKPSAFTAAETGTLSMMSSSNANAAAKTVALSGASSAPVPSLSPTSINFGNQRVNVASGTQSVTLTNTSTVNDLQVTSFSLNAAATTAGFATSNGATACANATLVAGGNASCVVNVSLTPTATGALSGTLTFTTNGNPTSSTVALSGNGYSSLAASPTSLSFGNQIKGTNSAAKTVALSNTSGASITLNSISIAGTNPGDFVQTNNCGSALANNASCQISVSYFPQAVQSSSATLTVASSDPNSPTLVSLSGTGVVGVPVLSLSTNQLDFGVQKVSTISAVQSVTVTNTGAVVMNISAISIAGTNASDFATAASSTCGSTLPTGASCRVDVTFMPGTGGNDSRQAALTVTSDAGTAQNTVSLIGTRVANTATTTVNGQTIALSTSCGSFTAFGSTTTPTGAFNANYAQPYGFFTFTANVNSCTGPVTFTYTLPGSAAVNTYLKCTSTTASSCAPFAGAQVSADGKRVTFQLTDNDGVYDSDSRVGYIGDPGAPAMVPVVTATSASASASSSSGAMGWELFLFGIPALMRRRRLQG